MGIYTSLIIRKNFIHSPLLCEVYQPFGCALNKIASGYFIKITAYNIGANNMKKIPIPYLRWLGAAGFLFAGSLFVSGATVIFSDNYNVPNGKLDTASLFGRTNGVDCGGVLPQSDDIEQYISGDELKLIPLGGDGTGDSGAMRFDTIGKSTTLWDWSSGTGGSDITSAGGMSITFNWTSPNTTSSDWIFMAVGSDPADVYGTDWKLLALSSATSSGVILENDGTAQAYTAGALRASGSFPVTGASHTVKLDYEFSSWAAGSPVDVSVYVDGHFVLSQSFTWLYSAGKQYMSLGTYQETNLVDNFNVSTFTGTISKGFSSTTFTNIGELPWGSHDDNGSEWYTVTNSDGQYCVTMSGGVLTLTSYYIVQNGYHYQSGVVYCGTDVPNSGYNFVTLDVDMYTPYAGTTGCWPAFWLDSAWTWPPEVDVAEFKGNEGGGNVWQNVDGTTGTWVCVISTITPGAWHHYGLALGPPSGGDRVFYITLDGVIKNQGTFIDTAGSPFWVIFNYAMEGSSGTPGPTYTTYVEAKNWVMATH